MSIKKLKVFASNNEAQKSTVGLELEKGFPKALKPARAWFNYLFNSITLKTNEIIEGLNELMAKEHFDVGDLYLTTASHTPESVAEKMGYGEWILFGQGKALVGLSESSADPEWTKEIETVFGDYEHQLTEEEMPIHVHEVYAAGDDTGGAVGLDGANYKGELVSGDPIQEAGGDQPHNNTQPSVIVAIWKRVS